MLLTQSFSDFVCAVRLSGSNGSHISDEIWNVLSQPQFRKSSQAELQGDAERMYKEQIRNFVQRSDPIHFVLIAFPWKLWRMPLKTDRKTPDLGELAFLLQVKRVDEMVRIKYHPGTRWTFCTEGEVYREMFGSVPREEIFGYIEGIKRFAKLLSLERITEFVSLADMYQQFSDFDDRVREERQKLEKRFSSILEVPEELKSFYKTFYCSQDLRLIDPGTIRRIFNQKSAAPGPSTTEEKALADSWSESARRMTIEYCAINQAKHLVGSRGVIHDIFPDALYVSVTQKPGRYAIHPVHQKARLLPHHGVPVLRADHRITIDWLDSVQHAASPSCRPIYLEGDTEPLPFCYQECL